MTPREMFDQSPVREGQESASQEKEGAPKTVTLGSRDVTKYHAGQRFDNGEVRGTIGRIDYGKSTIEVELDDEESAEEREAPKTVTLKSSDVTKYTPGQRFDNDEVRGIVRRKDYGKSTIEVELDDEEAPEQREAA